MFLLVPFTSVKSQPNTFIYIPLIVKQGDLWVNTLDRDVSLAYYQENYLLSEPPDINWMGSYTSCDPGTTDPDFKQAVLQRVNYFRGMAGVSDEVTFSDESNEKAQAAALVMSVNEALSHELNDEWTCYSPLADEGAGSANIALGVYGWDAIDLYMMDSGAGNDAVGHRRWILNPRTQIMGTGDIPPTNEYLPSNALVVFDSHIWDERPDTRDDFVAWPPPGYVPFPVVYTRWSFSYPGADFSQASVSMLSDDLTLAISQADPYYGYGENTIVWQIEGMSSGADWPQPNEDTTYTIDITDVLIDEELQDFSYQVIVFDPDS
ncbi:MAG: CAP domain-containing protein [Brevefilum sp.]|nr:CAP domain-containing protein [Brevefilum sp.]